MLKENRFQNFYLFIFILWYGTEIVFNTTLKTILGFPISKINNIVNWLIFVLLMIQIIFFQSYRKKELAIIMGITLPIVVATILSGSKQLLSAWMFIVAAKNSKLDKIIHTAYIILIIMIPMIVFLCLIGFIDDYTMTRGNIIRYSLGFVHPNQLGLRIVQLVVCHCYLHRHRLGSLNYIIVSIAILFLVKVPNSKTAYIVMIVLLCMLLLYNFVKNQSVVYMKIFEKSLFLGVLCFSVLSVLFSYLDIGRNYVLVRLDKWMSSRFSLCHIVWQLYGVSPLGQRIYVTEVERESVGIKTRLWLDNAYVSVLLRYGVLVFLIFSIGYLCLVKYMIIQKEYILSVILVLYALYGIMENGMYMVTHNIFLIAFSSLLYKNLVQYKDGCLREAKWVNSD